MGRLRERVRLVFSLLCISYQGFRFLIKSNIYLQYYSTCFNINVQHTHTHTHTYVRMNRLCPPPVSAIVTTITQIFTLNLFLAM